MASVLPLHPYIDAELYQEERRAIFARSWQFFGLSADLSRPGDYLAETLAGFPLVVVRDAQGKLHGFHNVCRHRGGPLVSEAKGRCDKDLVCRVHDWRFSFDGRLLAAPGIDIRSGMDVSGLGLYPIRVESWAGFLFVNLDKDAAPLADALGNLNRETWTLADRTARLRHSHPIACNWKIYAENHLSGYRIGGEFSTKTSSLDRGASQIKVSEGVLSDDASGSKTTEEHHWAYIWPNLSFTLYRGVLLIEAIRPTGHERTEIDHIFLHAPEDPTVDAAMVASEDVTHDNAWACERIQKNFAAGVFQPAPPGLAPDLPSDWFRDRIHKSLSLGQSL